MAAFIRLHKVSYFINGFCAYVSVVSQFFYNLVIICRHLSKSAFAHFVLRKKRFYL